MRHISAASTLALLLLASLLLGSHLSSTDAAAQWLDGSVTGIVVDGAWQAIPGVTVYLAHPALGRSSPRTTDWGGRFYFAEVQSADTPYYVEIYWGRNLVYRQPVAVRGSVSLGAIVLE